MNESEKRVVGNMIAIYCRAHHHTSRKELCAECARLCNYSMERLEHCLYGEKKPVCSACPIHCYREDKRLQIKDVMRFSGRKMMLKHPIDAIIYMVKNSRVQKNKKNEP
jgi:hypothetical protein